MKIRKILLLLILSIFCFQKLEASSVQISPGKLNLLGATLHVHWQRVYNFIKIKGKLVPNSFRSTRIWLVEKKGYTLLSDMQVTRRKEKKQGKEIRFNGLVNMFSLTYSIVPTGKTKSESIQIKRTIFVNEGTLIGKKNSPNILRIRNTGNLVLSQSLEMSITSISKKKPEILARLIVQKNSYKIDFKGQTQEQFEKQLQFLSIQVKKNGNANFPKVPSLDIWVEITNHSKKIQNIILGGDSHSRSIIGKGSGFWQCSRSRVFTEEKKGGKRITLQSGQKYRWKLSMSGGYRNSIFYYWTKAGEYSLQFLQSISIYEDEFKSREIFNLKSLKILILVK